MSADFKASSFIVKRAKPSSYQQWMPTFLCFLSVDLYFNTSGLESVLSFKPAALSNTDLGRLKLFSDLVFWYSGQLNMHISVYFLAQEYVRKGSEELFIPETILGWLENKEWLLKHLRCGFVVLLCVYVLFQSTDSYFVVHSIVRRGQCCQQSSPSIWLQSCACVFVCVCVASWPLTIHPVLKQTVGVSTQAWGCEMCKHAIPLMMFDLEMYGSATGS